MLPQAKAPRADLFEELSSRKLVIVSGKGGVGRTTVAALLGLALSARGKRVLIGTTGHDDRLAWMLGLGRLDPVAVRVDRDFYVQRLDPQTCIVEYGAMALRSGRVSGAVLDNQLVRRLLRAFPGLDDFAVLGKMWHEAVRGDRFDVVIFDGPASGHLVQTLATPAAVLRTQASGPLRRDAKALGEALADPAITEALLVGRPELWPLTELRELAATLRSEVSVRADKVVVNGVYDEAFAAVSLPAVRDNADAQVRSFIAEAAGLGQMALAHRALVAKWLAEHASATTRHMALPWRFEGIAARSDLEALLRELARAQSEAA